VLSLCAQPVQRPPRHASPPPCSDGGLRAADACAAATVRRAAVRALLAELVTYPKPGLVSLVDSGSHHDMDAGSFMRSSFALRHYFGAAAAAGAAGVDFEALRRLGLAAEARMLRATGGVNTHRGAIFNLGLLAAAAGLRHGPGVTLGERVQAQWGEALAHHRRDARSHGSRASALHGVGGALAEAAAGFPTVYLHGLPAYRRVLARGGSANQARVQAFFALMARLDDTNLLHRGGAAGLAHARDSAERFLDAGGVFAADWRRRATQLHRSFVARRLSPGGSADLLAACLLAALLGDG